MQNTDEIIFQNFWTRLFYTCHIACSETLTGVKTELNDNKEMEKDLKPKLSQIDKEVRSQQKVFYLMFRA